MSEREPRSTHITPEETPADNDAVEKTPASPPSTEKEPANTLAAQPETIPEDVGDLSPVLPTQESIDEAAIEQQKHQEYEQKITVVQNAVLERYQEAILKTYSHIESALARQGLKASNVNLYDQIKSKLASETNRSLTNRLPKEVNSYPLLQQMHQALAKDASGRIDAAHELADSNPAIIIDGYLRGKEKLSPAELGEVQKALKLSSEFGQYSLSSWSNDSALDYYLSLHQRLLRENPDLDLNETGFYETRAATESSYAAILLDLDSKPNYYYAKPEYPLIQKRMHKLLTEMSKVEAQAFLNENDIELPDPQ